MAELLKLDEGNKAVRLARETIAHFLKTGQKLQIPKDLPSKFYDKRGVFVTLETHPVHELRGCIGFPEPIAPLANALVESAIAAAVHDPRFNPVDIEELSSIVVEVSVLTPPERIDADSSAELVKKVKVGRDGLIVKKGIASGLLLPQVPVEWGWDVQQFLSQTCRKAGLPADTWLREKVTFYSFQAQVFSELSPNGKVEEKKLGLQS